MIHIFAKKWRREETYFFRVFWMVKIRGYEDSQQRRSAKMFYRCSVTVLKNDLLIITTFPWPWDNFFFISSLVNYKKTKKYSHERSSEHSSAFFCILSVDINFCSSSLENLYVYYCWDHTSLWMGSDSKSIKNMDDQSLLSAR